VKIGTASSIRRNKRETASSAVVLTDSLQLGSRGDADANKYRIVRPHQAVASNADVAAANVRSRDLSLGPGSPIPASPFAS
jgi:hypothetical protein